MKTMNLRAVLIAALMSSAALPVAAHDMPYHAAELEGAGDSGARRTELFKPGVSLARREQAGPVAGGRPPLYAGLGAMGMAVATSNPTAQAYFNQGLALAWAFNHEEARRAFVEAQRHDRLCAMCAWGEAWALGPNINAPMAAEAHAPALRAARRAAMLAERGVSPRERALIDAMAARYGENGALHEDRFVAKMEEAAAEFPQDVAVLTLYAEALMNMQPWDYWEADGATPKGRAGEIVATLERALELDPRHPAAIHFYIHAVEASATPERAEPYADALRGATPALGHLLHMPSHIYMRVGRHADSVAVNRAAVAADEALLAQMGNAASAYYRFGYYPHNLHFLMTSAMASGLGDDARRAADRLAAVTSDEVAGGIGWIQAISAAPYAVRAQFGDVDGLLAMPAEPLPFVEAHRRWARGMARLIEGDLDAAADEAAAVEAIAQTTDFAPLEAQGLPARAVLGIASGVLRARIAERSGDGVTAVALLREAAATQDALPYMEPPFWSHSVRRTLGAVLLAQGDVEGALAAFRAALAATPRDGWALWGLMQAQREAGDAAGAAATAETLNGVWRGAPLALTLARL